MENARGAVSRELGFALRAAKRLTYVGLYREVSRNRAGGIGHGTEDRGRRLELGQCDGRPGGWNREGGDDENSCRQTCE